MTLAVGTALHNGTYAIDAWVTDDAIGPVYLAMDVPRGQWVQLRVLGSRNPETLPDVADRQAFYRYLDQVNGLKHGALPQHLGGFEEGGVCYQVFSTPPGTPLDRLIAEQAALSPRASLAILRQLMEMLASLRPLGWAGLRLTPDQVWYAPDTQTLTFTGFDLASIVPPEPEVGDNRPIAPAETALVQGLSHLLYCLLTGQRAESTQAPLAVELRRCHPALPTSLDAALEAGSPPAGRMPSLSLSEWGALLPLSAQLPTGPTSKTLTPHHLSPLPSTEPATGGGSGLTVPTESLEPQVNRRDRPLPVEGSPPRRRSAVALALVFTGVAATASGLGFGLYARLLPANSAGSDRLNPNQSFPPLPDWNGGEAWQPWDDAPALRSRPDYGHTPSSGSEPVPTFIPDHQEPAAPPPAVSQPTPSPDPIASPEQPLQAPVEPWAQPLPDPESPINPTPLPNIAPAPAPEPLAPPPPLEAPSLKAPADGAAPPPLIAPPRPVAPAPASS
ncbi:MAG: hypothetical protein WBA99_01325 [Nodosilinea sp.]